MTDTTNQTMLNDDMDDTSTHHTGGNHNAADNLSQDHSKGGKAAHESGNAHKLTKEDQSEGGSH